MHVDDLQNSIHQSAQYLVKGIKEDGMFEYRINMDPTIRVKPKYNILRHAGSIYAMSMWHEMHPSQDIAFAIKQAGRYLQKESIFPVQDGHDLLAVWSRPDVNGSANPPQVKLGGIGLGLVALLSIEDFHPGFTELSMLQALGRFVVYMQKKDGSFYSKYIPTMGGCQEKWTSLYYPGEAALGLLMLYEKDASDIWMQSAYKALKHLADSREGKTNIPADHWALLATEKLLSLKKVSDLDISEPMLTRHAVQICATILRDQVNNPEQPQYDGGFSKDGRTTPTATRLEGLLAALSFLNADHEMRKEIELAVARGISFLLNAQIKDGKFAGAFPRAIGKINTSSPDVEQFNRRATEVRIDYIQHSMSAFMQYFRYLR